MSHEDGPDRDYAAGLPDHHDATSGIGGAPPALSALTLRRLLAGLGIVLFGGGAIGVLAVDGSPALAALLGLVAVVAVVNLVVVTRRKRRGEPG